MLYAIAMGQITRLPSNLRPTIRECVHLVRRGYFRLRDRDGGRTVQSAIAENSTVHANFTDLCVIESELFIADESFTLQELLLLLFIRTQSTFKKNRKTSNLKQHTETQ